MGDAAAVVAVTNRCAAASCLGHVGCGGGDEVGLARATLALRGVLPWSLLPMEATRAALEVIGRVSALPLLGDVTHALLAVLPAMERMRGSW